MISAEGVEKDYQAIMTDTKLNDMQKLLACFRVLLKLLVTMRSNQMLTDEQKKVLSEKTQEDRKKKDSK